jgi:hypothetical protein
MRHHVPQGLFNDRQPPTGFIDRGWGLASHLIGRPRRKNLTPQGIDGVLLLGWREVRTVAVCQRMRNARQGLHEGAAHDLRGMGGEHELDVEGTNGLVEGFWCNASIEQRRKGFVA